MKYLITIMIVALSTAVSAQVTPGDPAPGFSLRNVDGNMVSLSDYADQKGAIVIFTCNTCPVSIAYEQRILDLDKTYAGKGFPVIAINPNDPEVQPGDSFEKMQERAQERGFTFPYLFDAGQKVYPAYGATKTPHVFLLEKVGDGFRVAYTGAIDDNQRSAQVEETFLEDAIAALQKGKEPKLKETRAVGCGIKTK